MPAEKLYFLSGRPAVIYSAALCLFGGQLLSTGIIAELLLSYRKQADRKDYSIKQIIGDNRGGTSVSDQPK